MPPPPFAYGPSRIGTYYQTQTLKDGTHVSLLPLLRSTITYVNVAAIHINETAGDITLNDDSPGSPIYREFWGEVAALQNLGISVLGMLGGAAKGSFQRLDGDREQFENYYIPLRNLVVEFRLDGLDLDVEEDMSLAGIVRLIDRLKMDFGDGFLITLAPVQTALTPEGSNLSGFDYFELEKSCGEKIAWYNAQFYCGWGDMSDTADYDAIITAGWPPEKVVAGVLTNPANCSGYVEITTQMSVMSSLVKEYPEFGGVVGWEYFNSLPGGKQRPWEWVEEMRIAIGIGAHR